MKYKEFLKEKEIINKSTGFYIEDKDMNQRLFDFQRAIVKWACIKGRAAIFADCGLGKGQPYGSKVLTPSGWKRIEMLKERDKVIASNGKTYTIIGVFPKGEIDTYRFHFSDKSSFVVDAEHLHIVRTNNDRQRNKPWRVMSTKELLNSKIRYGTENKSRNYDIPVVSPVEFQQNNLDIPPYVMGVLIGDGCLRHNVEFNNPGKPIIDKVRRLLSDGFVLHNDSFSKNDHRISYKLSSNYNPFKNALRGYGLFGKFSNEKFIPKPYLYSCINDRIELLRGLMDTDGYIKDTCQYYTMSEQLKDDVMFLIRSLGGIPTFGIKKNPIFQYNGEKRYGKDCYVIMFSLKTFNPFSLPRKADLWNSNSRDNRRWIDRIEFEKKQKTVCISVDSPDCSYVTENFIVTHNTAMQLEWAHHVHIKTKKPVLILAPLAVSKQTKREGKKFDIEDIKICESHDDVINGINITNYEKLHKFNPDVFSGIVLDESSILKSFSSKTRNAIIDSFKFTPYKLACTATPSPNDFTELGNHSEFLNVLTRSEMLSLFFINDTSNVGTWRLKGHGQNKFWQWLGSWSVMLSNPSELGFDGSKFILPDLNIKEHVIEFDKPSPGQIFNVKAKTLNERRKARQQSIKDKIDVVKKITKNKDQWLIWCDLNNESEQISKHINGAIEVTGSQDDYVKESNLMKFINGYERILTTKPSIAGFGLNLQNCHNIIFFGLSDSYEQFYQAIRRCWRFGQCKTVNCHIITTDIEGNVVDNIKRKESDALKMRKEMIKHMKNITKKEINQTSHSEFVYQKNSYCGKGYELHLGDNVELIKKIKDDSIGLSIFSPPFASLFTYSNSARDMGNCRDKDDFLKHFSYLGKELYRVMMPGRLICIHCMNLPTTIARDGYIGLDDFRGDLIRLFQSFKFIFHSEICIWKDPLVQAVRTKALPLAHKQIVKDSSRCATGIPDYIVVMRKPGENLKPIAHPKGFTGYIGEREFHENGFHEDQRKNKFSHEIWQRYASPVWFDIRQTRVLSTQIAREDNDEKHICPLQLDTIERCLELWSAPKDIVLDPFNGIGSTVYCATAMGRYGFGIELKESYWEQSIKNLRSLERKLKVKGLF